MIESIFILFPLGLIILVSGVWIGILMFPYILHARASRSDGLIDGKPFDKSNRANTFNVIAHFGTHPEDFALMQYPDGKRPFHYLTDDLLSDTLDVRPSE